MSATSGQDAAARRGLSVLAAGVWPSQSQSQSQSQSPAEATPPLPPGFVVSSFSALAVEAARRCLSRRDMSAPDGRVTAVLIVSELGDVVSAAHVAQTVDSGGRVLPLLFFQSVPNSVAGYIAAKWQLTGPVVSVGSLAAGLDVAALLIEDGDAEQALLISVEQAPVAGGCDRAEALLLALPHAAPPSALLSAPPLTPALPLTPAPVSTAKEEQ